MRARFFLLPHRLLAGMLGLWLILSPTAGRAAEEVAVSAQVDRTTLASGESLQLTVTLRNGEGDVDVAGITDFKVISQGTRTSLQIVNGTTSREVIHNYLLVPQRKGRLTIPALAVTVDGRVLRTEPIIVTVAEQPVPDTAAGAREVWAEATVSASQPYVGQPITYSFSLYQAVQITNATFQAPAFDGFSAKELPERKSRRVVLNGREHIVTQIHYVLVPQAAGSHTIEPGVLQLGIVRPDSRRRRSPFDDFFDDPLFNRNRVEPKVLQGPALDLQVRPLPPYTGADLFSGLVGRFDLTAEVEKTQLKVGDSTTLTITVQGRGNIMDAQAPPLKLPEGIKTYADNPNEEIQLTTDGFNGRKTFRTALVPVQAGDVALPSVQWTYFDVDQGDYRTVTAALPSLQVQPSEGTAAPAVGTAESTVVGQRRVELVGRDILPLKEDMAALRSRRPMPLLHFLLWMAMPALAYGALCLVLRLRRADLSPAARMRVKARQALKTATSSGEHHDRFLTALYQALTAAIFFKAGRGGEALTWLEAEAALRDAGQDAQISSQAAELLSAIEAAKFSGRSLDVDQRNDLLARTHQMVRRLAP
ncbi:MAG: BatD family protein [Desulfatitalea sp.]